MNGGVTWGFSLWLVTSGQVALLRPWWIVGRLWDGLVSLQT